MNLPTKEQWIYWSSILYDIHLGKKSIFVIGYPKTGTNWVCNLLSSYYDTPVLESWNENRPITGKRIFHLHRFIQTKKVKNRIIYVIRDGRDAIVSRYFMVLRVQRSANVAIRTRFETFSGKEMREDNVKENISDFIRFFFEEEKSGSINYTEHVKYSLDNDLFTVKYEDLLQDKASTISKCIQFLSPSESVNQEKVLKAIEKNDFSKLKKQKAQNDSVFLRKGVSGDWKNHFTLEAAKLFNEYAGEVLIKTGYEKDDAWIDLQK